MSGLGETLLWPLIVLLWWITSSWYGLFGSIGFAVLLAGATVSLLLLPLQRLGARVEERLRHRKAAVAEEVSAIDPALKGEGRFDAVEAIYRRHRYHPFHNILAGLGFLIMLPVLLAGLLLFQDARPVLQQPFWLIGDLTRPDGLLRLGDIRINLLPILVLMVTVTDAFLRNRGGRPPFQFLLIAAVVFVLIYGLPAALVLFWLGSTATTLAASRLLARRRPPESPA